MACGATKPTHRSLSVPKVDLHDADLNISAANHHNDGSITWRPKEDIKEWDSSAYATYQILSLEQVPEIFFSDTTSNSSPTAPSIDVSQVTTDSP